MAAASEGWGSGPARRWGARGDGGAQLGAPCYRPHPQSRHTSAGALLLLKPSLWPRDFSGLVLGAGRGERRGQGAGWGAGGVAGSSARAGGDHEALGEDADAAVAMALQPGLVHCKSSPEPRTSPWTRRPRPGGAGGAGAAAYPRSARPRCPPAAGPGRRAPGRRSGAGPPPGRGQAGRPLPAAEEGTLQGGLRRVWGCPSSPSPQPGPAQPRLAHPALQPQL